MRITKRGWIVLATVSVVVGFGTAEMGHGANWTLAYEAKQHVPSVKPSMELAQHTVYTVKKKRAQRPGEKYRDCILHRESRHNYRSRSSAGQGGYQFIQSTWNVTAKRAHRLDLVGVRPDRASRADQDAMYFSAWRQGNGKFYWSARWGANYACWRGDVLPMRGQ